MTESLSLEQRAIEVKMTSTLANFDDGKESAIPPDEFESLVLKLGDYLYDELDDLVISSTTADREVEIWFLMPIGDMSVQSALDRVMGLIDGAMKHAGIVQIRPAKQAARALRRKPPKKYSWNVTGHSTELVAV